METLNKIYVLSFWEKWFSAKVKENNFREITNFWERRYYGVFNGLLLSQIEGLRKGSSKVLEAGSGSGEASLRLAQIGNDVTLLDASYASLEFSKINAKKKNVHANFMYGDLFNIPFPVESFDFTFNVGTIEEYDKDESVKIIREMMKVTKKGGSVVIGIPNPRNPEIAYSRKSGLWKGLERDYYEKDLKEMMKGAGLKKNKIVYVPTLFAFGYFNYLKPFVSCLPGITRFFENILSRYSVVIIGISKVE